MKTRQFIIAIGASAGGMNQINTFFDFTPLDDVSYIVIQHLSADYKSMMALLLAKHSKLNIVEAQNNMEVEMNKIYLIPSKNVMTIEDGKLLLSDKLKGINPTIDTFFTSLAKERGDKAIGIVLSGTGADGTEGIKAIKNAGGMAMASDPDVAEFNQMPASAIASGVVDYILPPDEMPKVITNYIQKKLNKNERGTGVEEEDEDKMMVAITDLIKDKLPGDFSGYKKTTILRRIKRRAASQHFDNLKSYLDFLTKDLTELQNLTKDFLISVTSFFRDKAAFDIIESRIIPELLLNKKNEEIKIWIAGCATGEEAYSMAILIKEQLEMAKKNNVVKIFATDIDSEAIQFAGKGYYSESIQKNVSDERLENFFTKDKKGYKIKSFIREMLIFANHDLVKNPPYCNMDLISCRNVLIYMNQLLQKKVLSLLHFGLKNGGYLFLGPSESVVELSLHLEEVDKKWKIYKNIKSKKSINIDTFISAPYIEARVLAKSTGILHNDNTNNSASPSLIDSGLLIEMGYSGIWVDENNQVLSAFGSSNRYLHHKLFVHHLPDLLAKSLQIAFMAACLEADNTNSLTEVKGIVIEDRDLIATLSVKPLITTQQGETKRLVLFSDDQKSLEGKKSIVFDENFYKNKYTSNLEKELKLSKEKQEFTDELLHASTENMQSFNEELLSANEEMQSTNEEMQSVNEELQTVNAEYQAKIKELSDLNDDLNNYFRSNVNGQIFVNKDLLLVKFSPAAANHINLLEIDLGRPLSNLSTNIRFETIEKDIKEVLVNGGVVTKEIQANNGKWFQVMTMPYLRKDNKLPNGAIITFNEISELKQIQQELDKTNKSLQAINNDLDNFVYTASHDLLSPINNMEQIIRLIKNQEEELATETKEYVSMLSSSVASFRGVIKEMSAIGKIESEMLKMVPVGLEEMISEILQSIQSTIRAAKAEIKVSLGVKTITFSKKNCRSIIYNLISNALKFNYPEIPVAIEITTKELPEYYLLTVKDNGIGIDKSKIQNIFRMYNRLNTETEGQGLGLFLINKIVDASGGKVEVESKPGQGSEFKIFFKK